MKSILFEPAESPYLVPFENTFRVSKAPTAPPEGTPGKKEIKKEREKILEELDELQRRLYADNRYSLLLIFQAMDAAGKDGTIRAVMSGVDPTGCQVFSFKKPSHEELDHDFLWRIYKSLPERGRIGIFNRSHYEEVLEVRVHPEHLEAQRLPRATDLGELWNERYSSIRGLEEHLARNGTVILKFWLNVSREEQRRRFVKRIDEPEKNWKFSPRDVEVAKDWPRYMAAYEATLNETSRPWAPWYAVPADDKPFMRLTVATLVAETLRRLELVYPSLTVEDQRRMHELRAELGELGDGPHFSS